MILPTLKKTLTPSGTKCNSKKTSKRADSKTPLTHMPVTCPTSFTNSKGYFPPQQLSQQLTLGICTYELSDQSYEVLGMVQSTAETEKTFVQ
jgi:hypothetical protein